MELRVLRYFLEAARLGNVSRAADNLCVTQPTVSRQLKELEEELGEKLFERTNYAIRLTPAGELLRERAEDILSMADRTVQDFKSLKEDEVVGEIAIACAESRNVNFLSKCIAILRDPMAASIPGVLRYLSIHIFDMLYHDKSFPGEIHYIQGLNLF